MKPEDKINKIKVNDKDLKDSGFVEEFDGFMHPNGDFIDQKGNLKNAFVETEAIDKEIEEEKQDKILHLRWKQSEIDRAKTIATKKGLKYQTYIKSILKQALDKDEKELFSN